MTQVPIEMSEEFRDRRISAFVGRKPFVTDPDESTWYGITYTKAIVSVVSYL